LREAKRRPDTYLELVRLALKPRRSLPVINLTLLELRHVVRIVANGRSDPSGGAALRHHESRFEVIRTSLHIDAST
jgi:hypothetical protein